MFDVQTARKAFAEKLLNTHDLDAAFIKAVWVAYKAGYADAGGVFNEQQHSVADKKGRTHANP